MRDPSRLFPFPLPWTKFMGLFLVTALGSGHRKAMGTSPPNPRENKKIQTLPAVRVPRTTGREEKKEEEWGLFAPKPLTRMSVGRNGRDGSVSTSPDPLLLAPDPFSWLTACWIRRNLGNYQQPSGRWITRDETARAPTSKWLARHESSPQSIIAWSPPASHRQDIPTAQW